MNHTPDLAEEAAGVGVDLYLCGRTHGGQVRVPVWGAIITNRSTGKRFEAGHYKIGDTDVYTSCGLGLGGHRPRRRCGSCVAQRLR